MKKVFAGFMLVAAMAGNAVCADTMEKKVQAVAQTVQDGCKKELSTFCKDVKPGEGRILACLYAFQDKVSSQCEYALYDAASQLEHAITQLAYLANECGDDVDKHCANVVAGEGRIINCLKKNEAKVTERCKQAMKDTAPKP